MNATTIGSVFNYYNMGMVGQTVKCRTQRDLATWLAGFAVACAAARLGVKIP
jgi:hypothetical protein